MYGDLAALGCALFFALCSMAFAAAGRQVGAMVVNQTRIGLAVVLLCGLHVVFYGEIWPSQVGAAQMWLLVLSGVVGLALGDLFLFHSLNVVGPRLASLLMATVPVFVVIAEGIVRDAWPSPLDAAWMGTVVIGVSIVLTGKTAGAAWVDSVSQWQWSWAIVAGLLGAVGQAAGLVLVKMVDDLPLASGGKIQPLSMTVVRMVAGAAGIAVVVVFARASRRRGAAARPMTRRALWFIVVGCVLGPTLGVWLSMIAVQEGDVGRAAVLIALTPVLMIPLAWLAYSERPTVRGWIGTGLAFVGTAALMQARG